MGERGSGLCTMSASEALNSVTFESASLYVTELHCLSLHRRSVGEENSNKPEIIPVTIYKFVV